MARFIASQCTQLTTSPATHLAIRAGSTGPTALPRPAHPVPHAPAQLCRGRFLGRPGVTSPGRSRGPVLAAGSAPGHESFELSRYVEAKIEHVQHSKGREGHIVFLKLMNGDTKKVVPVYIGDSECSSLLMHLEKRDSIRPLTYDLMTSSLEALGFRVTKVCVNALVGNTFHGRVHYLKTGPGAAEAEEVVVDSRPSDAINLAVRFGAPLYVNKEVAAKTAVMMDKFKLPGSESRHEIIESVRQQVLHFNDPTYMHKLQMQLAVQEERYNDAMEIRDTIDDILTTNRELGLIVAMETALTDERFEEAAALRDELQRVRDEQEGKHAEKQVSDGT